MLQYYFICYNIASCPVIFLYNAILLCCVLQFYFEFSKWYLVILYYFLIYYNNFFCLDISFYNIIILLFVRYDVFLCLIMLFCNVATLFYKLQFFCLIMLYCDDIIMFCIITTSFHVLLCCFVTL